MMKLITEELLDTVTSRAKENSRLRMNYNFHASMDAPIHRLLNALEPGLIFLLTVIQVRKKLIWFCAGVCWHFFMMMPVM